MKISILTKDLQAAIKKLNTITQTKENVFPGIMLETGDHELIVKKSNGESQIKINLDVYIEESGSVFIPINTIKLIEKLKNVNYLIIDENSVTADKKKIKFSPMDLSEYWSIKDYDYSLNFEISQLELNRMLTVKYAMAKDETRPVLQGINIKANKFCALDGYIVSLRESNEYSANYETTITQSNVKILDKIIDKKSDHKVIVSNYIESNSINTESKYIKYEIDNIEIICRVLPGEYIKYENIIPQDYYTKIEIDTNKLAENMEFLKSIKIDTMMLAKFNINETSKIVTVSGSTYENTIEDQHECKISGDNLTIGFNCEFILAMLKNYKDKNITMEFTSAVNPCVIREATDYTNNNLDMVLPVRIRNVESNVA